MFNSSPPRNPTQPKPCLSHTTGNMFPWPRDAEKPDAYEAADATAADDPDNTATAECKEDTETPAGNATDAAASYATAGRSEKRASHPATKNTNEPSTYTNHTKSSSHYLN